MFNRVVNEVKMWELQDLDPLPAWQRGRAILIGDAARTCTPETSELCYEPVKDKRLLTGRCTLDAMTPLQGQGANMSIEDGEAFRLLMQPGITAADVPAVLNWIDELRRPRVNQVVKNTREASFGLTAEERLARVAINADYDGILDYSTKHRG